MYVFSKYTALLWRKQHHAYYYIVVLLCEKVCIQLRNEMRIKINLTKYAKFFSKRNVAHDVSEAVWCVELF